MASVLIVEDDEDIRDILKTYLTIEKIDVFEADSLNEMREKLKKFAVDLILLDIMLADGDSIDELPNIRAKYPEIGVIIVSAKGTDRDKIFGIESGADDYVTKPFNPREVVARVRALLKRTKKENDVLKFGSLEIYPNNYSVKYKTEVIELTGKEFEVLHLLARNPDRIFSREEIIDKVWYDDDYITDRVVDVHISMIRSKIKKDWIKTVRNVGYRFNKDADIFEEE
ncbi:MAG TPA: response regulator transcription factor [Petrotogaceae bacterium]|jgi:two-component system OmpR family response regulator|nr:response regulator transcription factor [Petrotogaceae bacterium]HPA94334.1 response regulator transcription factor [Petrotogaceae bacterium]HPO27709.1 response regulator transcription factor [Petrotogaceae bacterium]HPX15712.1 response regulator transcription factor [Petrotogaceae bacterium]HQC39752.1 response regulator transcription factor [Petrotogaceae bacterium]